MKKKYTMKDIAKECGVSVATVSYVLNDVANQSISAETKKKILHVANMVGYVTSASARALATGRSNNFGVFAPYGENSAGKHKLLRALAEESERAGYNLVLLTDKCLKAQVTNVDAVFAVDITAEEFAVLGDNSFVPLLYLDGQINNGLFYCVTFDAAALRKEAMAISGCEKAVLLCDRPRCEDYREYLAQHFDLVLSPEQARLRSFADDTVILSQAERLNERTLILGQDLALDYAAYASAAVSAAVKAIARDETPAEHHIRI